MFTLLRIIYKFIAFMSRPNLIEMFDFCYEFNKFTLKEHIIVMVWKYIKAYEYLEKALQLNPQNALTLDFIAEIHRATGSFDEGLTSNQQALQLDPLSVNALYTRATLLYLKGGFADAMVYVEKGLQLDSNFSLLQNLKILLLILLNKKVELNIYLKEKISSSLITNAAKYLFALFHQLEIDTAKIDNLLEQFESLTQPLLYPWDIYINIYADKYNKALSLLESKVQHQMGQVISYKNDPFFQLLLRFLNIKPKIL